MSADERVLAELIAAVVDGTALPEQRARLEALLRAQPELRSEYVRQMRLDALLGFVGGTRGQRSDESPAAAAGPGDRAWWRRGPWLMAAAAIVILGLALFGWTRRGVPAEILAATGAAQEQWTAGTSVRLSQLALREGSLRLRLPSGVQLDVFGPLEMQFLNAMHVRVARGQVTADVGDDGKGFIVDTAQTQVVDLGTKFGVAVEGLGHTDVVVFQGEVELFDRTSRRRAESPLARLVEGQAVRVDARQQLSRIGTVTSGTREEEWSTEGGGAASVIASVRDNLRDPAALNYYRVVAGGMREDARAFVSKRHEWNGLDAAGMPAELHGADLVQTFASDRYNIDLEIVVTVARPAVLYVLADSRTPAPAWLADAFSDTGLRVGLENAPLLSSGKPVGRGPGEGNMAPFAVWRCELPSGGSIKLGPPRESPDENLQWMYGIAAKPL
jgi:hypothetical protein